MALAIRIQVRLLGRPQLVRDGRDVTAEIAAKAFGLLAYLALDPSKPVPREKLAGALWSDKTDDAARYRLRHTLWDLRRTLGDELVQSDQTACWLDLNNGSLVDLAEFQRGCRDLGVNSTQFEPTEEGTARLLSCIELYRGELLQGTPVRDAPLFEEWLLGERERLQLLFQDALWSLAEAQRSLGRQKDAAETLSRLIEADPLRERSYRALMGLYLSQGDRAAALRVYKQCVARLASELGVPPSPDTQRLHQMILQTASDSASAELERAQRLLEAGSFDEALAACLAADLLFPDYVTRSQIALLRAEIALSRGKPGDVLSFISIARQALRSIASGRAQ